MDFQLNDEQLQLKKSIREFAEREILPNVMKWDEAKSERKKLSGFVSGICLQPPVMHQTKYTLMLVVFGESVCQMAQRFPSLPFSGDRADHLLGLLPASCLS